MSSRSIRITVVWMAAISAACTGCANKTRTGALVGTGAGAGVGAIIGHQIGKEKEGALIGAAVGAASGALIGKKHDDQDAQQAYDRQVAHEEAEQQAAIRAVTNFDVIEMHSQGVSDQLIISTIEQRGGAFDTSATGIINLKHAQISDTVVMAMQKMNRLK